MKTGRGWWALAGFGVLTLLGLYVGAYYATAREPIIAITGTSLGLREPRRPRYPAEWMASFFTPVHKIDRDWIRPDVWNP